MNLKTKIGLAAGAFGLAGVLYGLGAIDYASKGMKNNITNAMYGRNVTTTKYKVVSHEIRLGDRIINLVGGNPLAADYAKLLNPGLDFGKLRPGTSVRIPTPYGNGETIPELYAKLYAEPYAKAQGNK